MLLIVSSPLPVLVSITVCALGVPTSWPAKLRVVVDKLTASQLTISSSNLRGQITVYTLIASE
jgi:hypothetical protein